LLDDIGIGLPVILAVRKTTLSTHFSTPFRRESSFFRDHAGQKVDLFTYESTLEAIFKD
jgi:hypothetical protein